MSQVQTAVTAALAFLAINMEVTQSITKDGKASREKVGDVTIYVPSVSELVADAVQATDKEGKALTNDDGLPVFTDDKHNWLQNAIYASVKASARNKLVPKTTNLKDGQAIATDWATLTAEAVGTGAVHLTLAREVKALFAKYMATLGKSAKAQEIATNLFNNLDVLAHSDDVTKGKLLDYFASFSETLTAEEVEKYSRHLTKVMDTAQAEAIEADDF